ncbi:hypothetical protein DMH15_36670 [Streptomyces sp. WAC 06725]|uniref:hypothetical protein n=1 Tax=Streptomyces sp. WAC 06725 TaxID=2203209 RepID=UPI000F738290|nr:hypothetical protein [Streptomyces sp. WAC 06725]RSO19154.1 hypothetical protein DMH15_36670 [Streptomyces sp. WAC 06725]
MALTLLVVAVMLGADSGGRAAPPLGDHIVRRRVLVAGTDQEGALRESGQLGQDILRVGVGTNGSLYTSLSSPQVGFRTAVHRLCRQTDCAGGTRQMLI